MYHQVDFIFGYLFLSSNLAIFQSFGKIRQFRKQHFCSFLHIPSYTEVVTMVLCYIGLLQTGLNLYGKLKKLVMYHQVGFIFCDLVFRQIWRYFTIPQNSGIFSTIITSKTFATQMLIYIYEYIYMHIGFCFAISLEVMNRFRSV